MKKHLFSDPIVDITLSEITRDSILQFRSRLIQKHGYSRTVQKVISLLKIILKEAHFREHIDRDPTVGIGKVKYEQREAGTFTEKELKSLFKEVPGVWKDRKDYTAFLLAATTGMRRGEVLALQWQDIHFNEGFIEVVRAWKGRREIDLPKWNKKRVVPIPQFMVHALTRLQEESIRIAPDGLVFCYDDGSRLGETWWKKRFTKGMENSKTDYRSRDLSPHSFRHTLNTVLRSRGLSDTNLRAAFGWTGERMQENCTHVQFEHLKDQADVVEKIFVEKKDTETAENQ